jgi:hypothetical protein
MQKAALSLLVAFQLLRTRSQRDQFIEFERQLELHLAKYGGQLADLEGWAPLDEDRLKYQHLELMRSALTEFAPAIAEKGFVLLRAAPGRSFYLWDNPVCLHNTLPADPLLGNVGLAVEGIEIYMPLSSDLMLVAYCPSILRDFQAALDDQERRAAATALRGLANGLIERQMKAHVQYMRDILARARDLLQGQATGRPIQMADTNIDFSNSLQMAYAREHRVARRTVALLPAEEAVRSAFDAAETVRRTPANRLEFDGDRRSVTLSIQRGGLTLCSTR